MINYYISSAELSAIKLVEAVRKHGFIENKPHGPLGVALRENAYKIHRDKRQKQHKAALDETYLVDILAV